MFAFTQLSLCITFHVMRKSQNSLRPVCDVRGAGCHSFIHFLPCTYFLLKAEPLQVFIPILSPVLENQKRPDGDVDIYHAGGRSIAGDIRGTHVSAYSLPICACSGYQNCVWRKWWYLAEGNSGSGDISGIRGISDILGRCKKKKHRTPPTAHV